MKKFLFWTLLMLSLSGCTYDSGRIRLFNYNLWSGETPAAVTISRGDTLYSIARRYDIPLREIIEVNNLKPPYSLNVGQVLRLPTAKYHVVAKGDTLYNISKRYNVDMVSLSKVNDLDMPYSLAIGQRLRLPGSVAGGEGSSYTAKRSASSSSSWSSNSSVASGARTAVNESYTPPPVKNRKTKFLWPVRGPIISNYGPIAKGRNNDGINIKAAQGTMVKAADKGTVAYAGNELKGFGNLILIRHDDGWVTAYAHNEKILVKKGQRIARGEKISTVGSTGGVASPQLHFEIRQGKKALNPRSYME